MVVADGSIVTANATEEYGSVLGYPGRRLQLRRLHRIYVSVARAASDCLLGILIYPASLAGRGRRSDGEMVQVWTFTKGGFDAKSCRGDRRLNTRYVSTINGRVNTTDMCMNF